MIFLTFFIDFRQLILFDFLRFRAKFYYNALKYLTHDK